MLLCLSKVLSGHTCCCQVDVIFQELVLHCAKIGWILENSVCKN